jgi:RluA family pseudouridine synthase
MADARPIEVLLDRDGVLAVNKPAGLAVVPGRGEDDSQDHLRARLERQLGRPVWVVHRIDKATSGLVLFASDAGTHRTLSMRFEAGGVERVYRAWVLGVPEPREGAIEIPIREGRKGRMKGAPDGKPSRTRYQVLRTAGDAVPGLHLPISLVEARLDTGRRHQIRLHFAYTGHPVLFDDLYAGPAAAELERARLALEPAVQPPRVHLHALALAWTDPDGRRVSLEAPLPQDFDPLE